MLTVFRPAKTPKKKIELYFEEHTRIESASIDQFGRVKIILSEEI